MSASKTQSEFATEDLRFGEGLTLGAVTAAREELLAALAGETPVRVHFDADSPLDLAGAQLLEAARRAAERDGADFALAKPADGPRFETLQRAGLLQTAEQRRFWLKEEG